MLLRSPWFPVGAIGAAFAAVSCVGIGDNSLWLDEAWSLRGGEFPLRLLAQITGPTYHPVTYYATLHGWIKLGGGEDVWIRLLSAAFMALSIPVVYALGKTVESHKAGLLAAVVFATSPLIYEFAREARPYAMLTCFAGVALMILAVGVKKYLISDAPPALIGLGWKRQKFHVDCLWAALMVVTIVAVTVHHAALAIVPICGSIWMTLILFSRNRRKHFINFAIFSAIVTTIYCVFFLPTFIVSWNAFSYFSIIRYPRDFLGDLSIIYGNGRVVMVSAVFVPPVLLAFWRWKTQRQWAWTLFFVASCFGMVVILLFVELVHGPVFKWRTLIWIAVPYSALVGIGLAQMKPRWLWLCFSLIVMTNAAGIVMVHQSERQPWEQLTQYLADNTRPGDGILVCPAYNHVSFARYWQGPAQDVWGYRSRNDELIYRMPTPDSALKAIIAEPEVTVPTLAALAEVYDRLWVVTSWHPECLQLGNAVYERTFHGAVRMGWPLGDFNRPGILSIRRYDQGQRPQTGIQGRSITFPCRTRSGGEIQPWETQKVDRNAHVVALARNLPNTARWLGELIGPLDPKFPARAGKRQEPAVEMLPEATAPPGHSPADGWPVGMIRFQSDRKAAGQPISSPTSLAKPADAGEIRNDDCGLS